MRIIGALGVALLSRIFGGLADKVGARTTLIAGRPGAALAYVGMAFGEEASTTEKKCYYLGN